MFIKKSDGCLRKLSYFCMKTSIAIDSKQGLQHNEADMKATTAYIEKKFEEFNQQMFDGELPQIPIVLSDAKTFLGACTYKKKRNRSGKVINYDFKLRMNTRIDLPEEVIDDTVIHEMIHYYIAYHQWKDTSAHGELFLKTMNDINRKFGRNITVSHKGTKAQTEQAIDTKQRWHVVALVQFKDGRNGIKVLPRVRQSILFYYNNVMKSKEIADIRLFMSKDVFFNRYPCSKALKVHLVDKDEVTEHLTDAEIIPSEKIFKRP